jgi:hypothetical protein
MLARTLIGAAVLGLLADAAPSCGPRPLRPQPQATGISVRGPACTCASEPVDLTIDSRVGAIACESTSLFLLDPGQHMVTAGRGGVPWKRYEVTLTLGSTANVQIECPAADAK